MPAPLLLPLQLSKAGLAGCLHHWQHRSRFVTHTHPHAAPTIVRCTSTQSSFRHSKNALHRHSYPKCCNTQTRPGEVPASLPVLTRVVGWWLCTAAAPPALKPLPHNPQAPPPSHGAIASSPRDGRMVPEPRRIEARLLPLCQISPMLQLSCRQALHPRQARRRSRAPMGAVPAAYNYLELLLQYHLWSPSTPPKHVSPARPSRTNAHVRTSRDARPLVTHTTLHARMDRRGGEQ